MVLVVFEQCLSRLRFGLSTSSGLDIFLPLFYAGCNSCSIIAARLSVLGQVWSSYALTFLIYRLCLRFIVAFSPHGSLPRVPSQPLGSL